MNWNPRYVAYAKSHGMTPRQRVYADKREGGMWRFMAWIGARINEYKRINPCGFTSGGLCDHDGFTAHCNAVATDTALAALRSR